MGQQVVKVGNQAAWRTVASRPVTVLRAWRKGTAGTVTCEAREVPHYIHTLASAIAWQSESGLCCPLAPAPRSAWHTGKAIAELVRDYVLSPDFRSNSASALIRNPSHTTPVPPPWTFCCLLFCLLSDFGRVGGSSWGVGGVEKKP